MINMPETETNAPRIRRRRKRKPMSKTNDMPTMNDMPTTNDAMPAPAAPVAKAETAWDGYAKTDRECECNAALYGLFLG